MSITEILIIVVSVLFVISVFSYEIYKKVTRKPSEACCECRNNMKRAVIKMRKEKCKKNKLEN